jgi:hypothetical protein
MFAFHVSLYLLMFPFYKMVWHVNWNVNAQVTCAERGDIVSVIYKKPEEVHLTLCRGILQMVNSDSKSISNLHSYRQLCNNSLLKHS